MSPASPSAEERKAARERRYALCDRFDADPKSLTAVELSEVLTPLYEPVVVPPCRLCGAKLTCQRFGAGATVWGCSGRAEDGSWLPGRSLADDHYSQSRFEDHRVGGDPMVMECLRRLVAAEAGAAS